MAYTKNPEVYLNLNQNHLKNQAYGIYKFLDYNSKEYLQILRQYKVITFDSGEHSRRREYIQNTLYYLLNFKGIPTVVLSMNSEITRNFLNRIPNPLREKILNIGLFHTYLQVLDDVRSILKTLHVNQNYRLYIDSFLVCVRSIEIDLIKKLSGLGLLCILDRSIISDFLYSRSLLKDLKDYDRRRILLHAQYDLAEFKPYASFYVHSEDVVVDIKRGEIYDFDPQININLKSNLSLIKEKVPHLVELEVLDSFEENMKKIKNVLQDLF
jgi:hypothetical protein